MKKKNHKGFILFEALIAISLFIISVATLTIIVGQLLYLVSIMPAKIQMIKILDTKMAEILAVLKDDYEINVSEVYEVDGFSVVVSEIQVDNFSKRINLYVELDRGRRIINQELSVYVTNTLESEGQSSCRPNVGLEQFKQAQIVSFDLSQLSIDIKPTDIVLAGNYAYISSNTSKASDPDLFIFDISDTSHVLLVSFINTGPGVKALSVSSNFVYLANTSTKAQLQIVDIQNRSNPILIHEYKSTGTYGSSTPIGNAIFYKSGMVYLGLTKSDIAEFEIVDVKGVPTHVGSYEIGNGVNSIFAFKNKVYIASPNAEELMTFSVSTEGQPIKISGYNEQGSTGNGKSLSLFLDTINLGKTYTFSNNELIRFSILSTSPISTERFGASVQNLLEYGQYVYILLHKDVNNFQIYDTKSQKIIIEKQATEGESVALDFSCDKNTFIFISENSSVLSFIVPINTPTP